MLKKLNLNGRLVPVPVPIKTLEQALDWCSDALLKPEEVLTKVTLNSVEVTDNLCLDTPMSAETLLEVKADSPVDLSIQSLDVVVNLSGILKRSLKSIAVRCWQTLPAETPDDAMSLQEDVLLICELLDHSQKLVSGESFAEELGHLLQAMHAIRESLCTAYDDREWQTYARVLLNQLEPFLDTIADQTAAIQSELFSRLSEKALQRL